MLKRTEGKISIKVYKKSFANALGINGQLTEANVQTVLTASQGSLSTVVPDEISRVQSTTTATY